MDLWISIANGGILRGGWVCLTEILHMVGSR